MTTAKYYGKIMIPTPVRPGIADCWNAFMVVGADFSESRYDIPLCPTTAAELPKSIISWREALALYYDALRRCNDRLDDVRDLHDISDIHLIVTIDIQL